MAAKRSSGEKGLDFDSIESEVVDFDFDLSLDSFGAQGQAQAQVSAQASERAVKWASTMRGEQGIGGYRQAHLGSSTKIGLKAPVGREVREEIQELTLSEGATRARGAGNRVRQEEPDDLRTCFERDRDRILHSSAFRRLAGKTQVFIFPQDHQRTRLTHALEVAQVATAVARATGLNVALVEAIALGHDCGHGPGGHASEEALNPYLEDGFDHATWGADVVLEPLNLTTEVLDGIRNHSWSRPAPFTAEGEVVAWADRCAYVAHDLEDACRSGIVDPSTLPRVVLDRLGAHRSGQLRNFVHALVDAVVETGQVGMADDVAEALAALRSFNYNNVYLRPESVEQGNLVVSVLRSLVEHFAAKPWKIPKAPAVEANSKQALRLAVRYVGGMTDRFAFNCAMSELGWASDRMPRGFDTAGVDMAGIATAKIAAPKVDTAKIATASIDRAGLDGSIG